MPYIGPNMSLDEAVQWAVENYKAGDATKTGGAVGAYNGKNVTQSKVQSGITKVGAVIRFYDPEITAILAAEL